jgi:Ca2+-binding RTX toxin-like protein
LSLGSGTKGQKPVPSGKGARSKRKILFVSRAAVIALLATGVAVALTEASCEEPGSRCEGTSEGDRIAGTNGQDGIYANGGDDFVVGYDGDDLVYGGEGSDTLYGKGGADTISGEAGSDYISGHWGRNTLHGGGGGDTISGDYGEDRIYGGEGDDTIEAGSVYRASVSEPDGYRDLVDCGPGTDTVSYERDVDRVESNCEYKYRMPVYPTPSPEESASR